MREYPQSVLEKFDIEYEEMQSTSNLSDARNKTYEVVDKISWENEYHRKDIANNMLTE